MLRKEKDLYYEKSSDNRGGSSRDDGSDHSSFKRGRSSCIGTYGPRREKILSTGNGRCNFTNTYQDRSCYHSDNESFPWKIIEKFNAEQIIKLFEELGVYAKNRNGYMYPYSDQASSVTEALKMELERLQIDVRLQTECTDIFPRKKGFTLQIVKDGKRGKYMRIM